MTRPGAENLSNLHVLASVPADASEYDVSDPEWVEMLAESQRRHFWFEARNRRILEFLRRDGVRPPARFLEVGCGTGTVLTALHEAGYAVEGAEMHEGLAADAARACPAASISVIDVRDPPPSYVKAGQFDAVGLFDVIEHVDDAGALLRACAKLVRPGGQVTGTVPALRILWSDYDEACGHRLRYTERELRAVLERAGLRPLRCEYFFQVLLPGLLVRRLLIGRRADLTVESRRRIFKDSLRPPGAALNALLMSLCDAERAATRALKLGFAPGSSIWFSATVA